MNPKMNSKKNMSPFVRRAGFALLALAFLAPLAVGAQGLPDKVCVYGFSKDFGALRLNSGVWSTDACTSTFNACRTLAGDNASAGGFFTSDNAQCANGFTCDEAQDLDGRFEADVDVRIRLQDPCPVRGAWEGSFRLLDPLTFSVVLAFGTIEGTLGVGTHREEQGPVCEGCRVARWDPVFQRWYFHSEGFIRGEVLEGQHAGCDMRLSFQGEFNANGDPSGPLPPNYNWGFEGKVDGVLLCPCQ